MNSYIIFCVFLLTPHMSKILWVTFSSQSLKKRYPFNVTGHILHPYKMKGMFDLLMDDAFHFKWYLTCSESRKWFDFLKLVKIHSPVNFCFTRTYSYKAGNSGYRQNMYVTLTTGTQLKLGSVFTAGIVVASWFTTCDISESFSAFIPVNSSQIL